MTSERWQQIKIMRGPSPRMVHKSCECGMKRDPLRPNQWIPWVEKPGHTWNIGRNAMKRELRAGRARKQWPTLGRAA